MEIKRLNRKFGVSSQIALEDLEAIRRAGYQAIICNRPDDEEPKHTPSHEIEKAAHNLGISFAYVPAISGDLRPENATAMERSTASLAGPVLAYCRSGARSAKLLEMAGLIRNSAAKATHYDIVIVGGGSAGVACAASIRKRNQAISIALIEPNETHYYQPGWTMVGAGVFQREFTMRPQEKLIPHRVEWVKASVSGFNPDLQEVHLCDGSRITYRVLIACPGIKLDWAAIPGLEETLGQNGVTSNYGYDLAPYTYSLVKQFQKGRALFTQPTMPIKCAGAPQKAMYLSCYRWEQAGKLGQIDVQFHTATPALFGVAAYVPALMEYVKRYGAHLNFESKLVAIDGKAKTAVFDQKDGDGKKQVEERFDMIHVVPPQTAPDFIRTSPLAAASGFIEVDEATLQHKRFSNIFALGDACSASNAKTAAAARKQAPIVAVNALSVLEGGEPLAVYDGYGSCPLTVEAGKIVLAEFGYGGKLLPSFPLWLIDGTKPSRLSWLLKDTILPPVYWEGMLKGREWLAKPRLKTS